MEEIEVLHITPWERSALERLANGQSAAELACALQLPELEIEQRLAALFSRMGASCDAEAVSAALRRGLIPAVPGRDA
jgi:DNA-binding NarL/FixJ family response regulator